ncbi:MAG: hypothetical protein LBH20_08950 [Treponema sp.]|jgi:hypothetical protein|nr:hypothetical protein [Treponema sp.]
MKKIIVLAMVAILLASGLVLASCGGCPGDGKCQLSKGNLCKEITKCAATLKSATDAKCDC